MLRLSFVGPLLLLFALVLVAPGADARAGSVVTQAQATQDEAEAPEGPRGSAPGEDSQNARPKTGPVSPFDGKDKGAAGAGGKNATAQKKPSKPVDPRNPEERAKLLKELYAKLKASKSKSEARQVQRSIERLWLRSGSPTIDLLMRRSTAALGRRKPKMALQLLDKVVGLEPTFVEGWNRRAFINFSQKRYGEALGDLQHVLAIDPNHFKAIEGLVKLMGLLEDSKGQLEALKLLVKVHPFWPKAKELMEKLETKVQGQPI